MNTASVFPPARAASSESPAAQPATAEPVSAQPASTPTTRWLRAAFLLSGAGQLIIIGSLTYLNHPEVTWAALLLAIAPAPLAALTAFGPRRLARWLAIITALVVAAGLAGWATHAGWLFAPALASLIVVCLRLWQDLP